MADACHLDDRRAPSFVKAMRNPTGLAKEHWTFQNKLLQPQVDGEQLLFTSKTPFSVTEAAAWWVCYDALKYADSDMRLTTSIMSSLRPGLRFAARSIKNVESPDRLAEVIITEDWLPIDAHIKVTDVATLARRLGGEQLYGEDYTVPLRELIQNASDAVRARRMFEDKPEDWGAVAVRMGKDENGTWIEVEDTGIGMSVDVLRGPFLDFGRSYWGSELMLREWPGLLSKGFVPAGRFGIGFYSVFMWGKRVFVTTQQLGEAKANTFTLQFEEGLDVRPLIRRANRDEASKDGGTKVRVWLKDELSDLEKALKQRYSERPHKLDELCQWLCPSLDVNLDVEWKGKRKRVISAFDWMHMDGLRLFKRIIPKGSRGYVEHSIDAFKAQLVNLRDIRDRSGKIVGRGCLLSCFWDQRRQPRHGLVTAGGFRASTFEHSTIFGIFTGKPNNATRTSASPTIDPKVIADWASEQGRLSQTSWRDEGPYGVAGIVRRFGGDTGLHLIGRRSNGWITIEDLRGWRDIGDEVVVIDDTTNSPKSSVLNSNVIAVSTHSWPISLIDDHYGEPWPSQETVKLTTDRQIRATTEYYAVIQALAIAWHVSMEEVIRCSDFSTSIRTVGKDGEVEVKAKADILRNPRKLSRGGPISRKSQGQARGESGPGAKANDTDQDNAS
jgi:hypothetical protein